MGFAVFCSAIIVVVFSKYSHSDFLPIQWNISADVGLSRKERLYEYPMFTDVAPATCDLTESVCDAGCCRDPDCDKEQREIFICRDENTPCSRPFAQFDCNCNSERPFWFPVLCYVFENPIYLGLFYKNRAKIENSRDFIAVTYMERYKYHTVEKFVDGKSYVFGLNVLAYTLQNGSYTPYPHALLHDNNMLSGLSLDCHIPVKYMKNRIDSCYLRLTKEKCEDGISFGAKHYLLRNEDSTETNNIPLVLRNLRTEQLAVVSVTFRYSPLSYVMRYFKGHPYKYFYSNRNTSSLDINYNMNLSETHWSDLVCHNVLVRAAFKFITNASEILKIEIQLELTNVSILSQLESVYLKRVHDVSFVDVNSGGDSDSDSDGDGDDYVYNRGYYIGESMNFGYIRENGSHMNWEKGQLKIFLNGGSCDRSRDITFGYNTYSVCVHPIRLSGCSQIREEITMKLELLTRGDYLAPYGNYRDTRRSAVPLLRAYNWTEWMKKTTDCLVPVQQEMVFQYTTSITPKGFPVYEAVGAMINRTFVNLSDENGVTVTVRVLFVDVTPSGKKPLSRFWERVYSPEESENAWFNIFNIFDRPVSDRELEESTFWFLLPVVIICSTFIVLRDFR